eukprot:UN12195
MLTRFLFLSMSILKFYMSSFQVCNPVPTFRDCLFVSFSNYLFGIYCHLLLTRFFVHKIYEPH